MLSVGRKSVFWPVIAITPALLLFALFILFPTIGNLYFSFTNYNGDLRNISWNGLANYEYALITDAKNVVNSLKVTAIFSVGVTVVQNLAAIFLAVLLTLNLKFKMFYRSIIFLPNLLGVVVVGFIWSLIFDPYSGPVNSFLKLLGMNSALLGNVDVALYLVIFVQIWMTVGYAMIIYIAGLQGIPNELYEAVTIDGATSFQKFVSVTIPQLWPVIIINIMLSLIGSLKVYDTIMVMTNGGPGQSTMTIGMYIFYNLFNSGLTQGYASALSFIHFIIILIVVIFVYRILQKRTEGYGWD